MAELAAPPRSRPVEALARHFGSRADMVYVERRAGFDLYHADLGGRRVLVKVGPQPRLTREAENLRRAGEVVGDLAPALLGFVATAADGALLVMQYVPGVKLEPGGLSPAVWNGLVDGLMKLHGHAIRGVSTCTPLAEDFVTLSVGQERYASLPGLRPLLCDAARRVAGLDADAALALFDGLSNQIVGHRAAFECSPRLVHADLWPENVLVDGARCWLIDWAWLKYSDYALDLANLKLILDWVWPPWTAQLAFERLLQRYGRAFDDPGLIARISVLLPIVSLIHLVQFAQEGLEDPYNAAAMRACFATARRDRALWARATPAHRVAYAVSHQCPSENGAWDRVGLLGRARSAAARLAATMRSARYLRSPAGRDATE
jgi:hypothetical protein